MIPFLPELPLVTPGAPASGAFGLPGAELREPGTSPDFAGLLSAALPEGEAPASALTNLPARVPPLTISGEATLPAPPAVPAPLFAPPAFQREVPEPPATRLPSGTILPESGDTLPLAAAPDTAMPAAPTTVPALPVFAQSETHTATGTTGAPESASAAASEDEDSAQPDVAIPVPVAVPVAPPIAPAAAPPPSAPTPARLAVRTDEPRAEHRARNSAVPVPITVPEAKSDGAPAPSAMPAETPSSPAAATTAPPPAPAIPALAPPTDTAPSFAERAEPRSPAPQQESAIAQVGELREALRAVRPEMTLRHADFGAVSLRIEPTASQDWRAVLASRDPGFVPAIHAALAERAVAPTGDTASAGHNPGQNGNSDPRYGASPNGGQGSSQPYLGHSGTRDEGRSPHPQHRQPSTTDSVAARVGEAETGRPDRSERGVFA